MSEDQTAAGSEGAVPTAESENASSRVSESTGTDVTPASQEVRFATAMTGGVSLAVWMGGVARELNLLDQASRIRELPETYEPPVLMAEDARVRRLYGTLLDLLDQVVRIDVLSGTSAGGLNAVFLGLCHARGRDLGALRDTWFDAGALDVLLRKPQEKAPPSLMQGDAVFLSRMYTAISDIAGPTFAVGYEPKTPYRDTTVYVTTTLLNGETSRFTDSYGTVVPDVDHLGILTFSTKALTQNPDALGALALAARSSASFPGAFEPAFLPFADSPATKSGPSPRPAMKTFANITRPHWVADGGILANRPIGPLLEAIFARPADDREVRRVLLYIVPDPGGTPDPKEAPQPEALDQPFSLGTALISDLQAALNQSIAADLSEIRRHNDRVDSVRDTRLRIAELGPMVAFPSPGARADFAVRQGETIARPIVDRLMRAISTLDADGIPAGWTNELAVGASFEERCRDAVRIAVTKGWPDAPATYEDLAKFGRSAYDGAKAIVLTLIRSAFRLATTTADRENLSRLGSQIAASFIPGDSLDIDGEISEALAADAAQSKPLTDLAGEIAKTYMADRASGKNVDPDAPASQPPVGGDGEPVPTPLAEGWRIMSAVLSTGMRQMQALITAAPLSTTPTVQSSRPTRRDVRARAASRLKTYLTYLGNDPRTIPFQLLKLHIAERSMLPVAMDAEQPVELIQVSANTRSLLDPSRRSAKDKLTGMQLNHFGAFYKRSWRANDWMWGRLDGAGWLVHVLLDPRRILAVVDADATYPAGRRAETFVSRLETRFPELPKSDAEGKPHRNAALEELKFLDDDAERIPASIPATALWLAWAWHVEIANAELPVVATEMLATPTRRDTRWAMNVVKLAGKEQEAVAAAKQAVAAVSAGNSTRVANRMIRHAEQPLAANRALLYRELPNCPVPDEKLSDERGEPLFARTLAQTAAVATAAMTAIEGTPATLRPALSGARTVTLTAYRAVDITGAVPKRLLVAGVLASAVGVFLAVQHSSLLGMTGTLLLLTGLYLIALGAWGLSKRAIPVLGTITVITAIAALCLPFGRRHLYGTGADDPGWLSKTVEPWLRNSWWAGLAAIAIIVAIGGLWGFIASLMSHKASAKHRRSHQSKAEKKMEGANKKVRRTQTVPPVAP